MHLWLGNIYIHKASYGHNRPDLFETYRLAGSPNIGFSADVDLTRFGEDLSNGIAHLHIEIQTNTKQFIGLTKTILLPSL